ncbi:MAG TPA: hypothetical protein VK862_10065 [Afifellaceae bacterium]|nr:hypothetical protein [Afifellaceae bacterium]
MTVIYVRFPLADADVMRTENREFGGGHQGISAPAGPESPNARRGAGTAFRLTYGPIGVKGEHPEFQAVGAAPD